MGRLPWKKLGMPLAPSCPDRFKAWHLAPVILHLSICQSRVLLVVELQIHLILWLRLGTAHVFQGHLCGKTHSSGWMSVSAVAMQCPPREKKKDLR